MAEVGDAPRWTRRRLLAAGLGVVGLGAAACSDEPSSTSPITTMSTTTTRPPDPDDEVVLVNTALSLEALAVYGHEWIATSDFASEALRSASTLFIEHHTAHRDALAPRLDALGVEPFPAPNPYLRAVRLDPALARATDGRGLAAAVAWVEQLLAQYYVRAAVRATDPELRILTASMIAVEGRHAGVLGQMGGMPVLDLFASATVPLRDPLPVEALVTA